MAILFPQMGKAALDDLAQGRRILSYQEYVPHGGYDRK